jgi:hypothetical protein
MHFSGDDMEALRLKLEDEGKPWHGLCLCFMLVGWLYSPAK